MAGTATIWDINIAFDPKSIAGLFLWVKADSLSLSDGDPVGTWADQSAQANDLTQATGANKPTYKTAIVNGLPVVRFTGANSTFLSHADNASFSPVALSVFVVAKTNSAPLSGNRILVEKEAMYRFITTDVSAANIAARLGSTSPGWASGGVTGSAALTTSFSLWELTYDNTSGNVALYVNGAAAGTASFSGDLVDLATVFYLGCFNGTDYFWDGDVAELLLYNTALGTTNRQLVETYLKNKYGL